MRLEYDPLLTDDFNRRSFINLTLHRVWNMLNEISPPPISLPESAYIDRIQLETSNFVANLNSFNNIKRELDKYKWRWI